MSLNGRDRSIRITHRCPCCGYVSCLEDKIDWFCVLSNDDAPAGVVLACEEEIIAWSGRKHERGLDQR